MSETYYTENRAVVKAQELSKNHPGRTFVVVRVKDQFDACPIEDTRHVYSGAEVMYVYQDGQMTAVNPK